MSSSIIKRIESSSWEDLEQIVKRNEVGIKLPWYARLLGEGNPYFLREIVSLSYALYAGPRINLNHNLKIDFPGTHISPDYVPGFVVDTKDVTFSLHGIEHTKAMKNLLESTFGNPSEEVAIVTEPRLWGDRKSVV